VQAPRPGCRAGGHVDVHEEHHAAAADCTVAGDAADEAVWSLPAVLGWTVVVPLLWLLSGLLEEQDVLQEAYSAALTSSNVAVFI
jgi:hypothetical protein